MDLRQQIIQLSEAKECSDTKDYEALKGVRYLKLNTKDGTEVSMMAQKAAQTGNAEGLISKALLLMICDENGELIFKSSDFGLFEKLPIGVTSEMFNDALEYNNIKPSNPQKEVEDAAKN